MKVYALVGESGSGKSYKALELAYDYNINYIIDDGILIHNNKIIAGLSAKQASTKTQAVKIAIFNNEEHRNNVKEKLLKEDIDKILVIGTSNKMINKIISRLGLGKVNKTIYIEEISTKEEINTAKKSRKAGNHIIPVSTLEVKPIASGLSINPIKKLFKREDKESIIVEKTIIKPTFSYIGKFYISKNAISQIIIYELSKIHYIHRINTVKFENEKGNLNVFLALEFNEFEGVENVFKLQQHIIKCLYKMTLINVDKIDIRINKINYVK